MLAHGPMPQMPDLESAQLSDHARAASGRRLITEDQVRTVLRTPQKVVAGNRAGRKVAPGTVTLSDPPLRVLLRVVVDLTRNPTRGGHRLRDHAAQALGSRGMKITYDSATDTLTIVLRDAPVRLSEEERSGVILDYDAGDRLIAIEVLDASTRVDRVDTVQLQVTSKPGAKHPAAAE